MTKLTHCGLIANPIADLLTRMRNGSLARHRYVDVPLSKIKLSIVTILKDKGFIAHYLVKEEDKKATLRIFLKYSNDRTPVIQGLKQVSKPSLRRYVGSQHIPQVRKDLGIAIVSTSHGVLEGNEAREKNIGGELLCLAW